MSTFWVVAYLVLAVLAVAQAAAMVLQTWEHRRFARSRLRRLHYCRPRGRAMVFVPCKGHDVALEENLRRLFQQDYDDYQITFIVQDARDPACRLIRRLREEHPERASRLVVAGRASTCGQKVHNLRAATERLDPRIEYLVFVDSDAQPRREWLRALVGRLGERGERVGAATGYRWLVPARPSFAGHLIASINGGVAVLLGSRAVYPVWGGSWAIRREVFEWIGLREVWRGTLSDDLVATKLLGRHRLRVKFEPAAMVATPWDGDLADACSFLRRQYVITRFYTSGAWLAGLLGATLPSAGWLASLGLLAWGCAGGGVGAVLPCGVLAAMFGLSLARAALRQDVARLYFPSMQGQLDPAGRFDLWAGPLVGLANWLGLLASAVGRHTTWRGITYRLHPGGQIRIVSRQDDLPDEGDVVESEEAPATEPLPSYRKAA